MQQVNRYRWHLAGACPIFRFCEHCRQLGGWGPVKRAHIHTTIGFQPDEYLRLRRIAVKGSGGGNNGVHSYPILYHIQVLNVATTTNMMLACLATQGGENDSGLWGGKGKRAKRKRSLRILGN